MAGTAAKRKFRIEYQYPNPDHDDVWYLWSFSRSRWDRERTEQSAERLQKAYPRRKWRVTEDDDDLFDA